MQDSTTALIKHTHTHKRSRGKSGGRGRRGPGHLWLTALSQSGGWKRFRKHPADQDEWERVWINGLINVSDWRRQEGGGRGGEKGRHGGGLKEEKKEE